MESRFYDFKKGTRWVYDAAFDGSRRTAVITAGDRDGQRTPIAYDLFNPPDPGATASTDEIWYVEDGYVVWGDNDLGKTTPWWRVYRLGSKKGDTWKGPSGRGEAVHLGAGELAVPAGRYTDVIHIRLTDMDGKTHDFHYAPRVGLVKWETTGRSGRSVLQLREFREGG